MLAGGSGQELIARDTIFAAIMIVCNGIIGLAILLGGIRHGAPEFRVEGTNPALTVLAALATLTLVLPTFTISAPGHVLHQLTAGIRRHLLADPVRHVRVHPDRAPSRLFSAG